jgi:SAM-dependent methyltransferase
MAAFITPKLTFASDVGTCERQHVLGASNRGDAADPGLILRGDIRASLLIHMNPIEEKVREFYDQYGWVSHAGVSGEDALFRDFSAPYYPYHARVDARTLSCFAGLEGSLLIAGSGDLPAMHLAIARRFSDTTCLDLSKVAIEIARRKLEGRGQFILGSILDIPLAADHFDAVYCAHVIYHIDKDRQHDAIRELIRVTRPGGRVIVIYGNPRSLPSRIVTVKGRLPFFWKLRRHRSHPRPAVAERPPLYYFAHPLYWWRQFSDQCDVQMKPWDVMANTQEEAILLNDTVAALGYRLCSWLESSCPGAAARWWQYVLVMLTKNQR